MGRFLDCTRTGPLHLKRLEIPKMVVEAMITPLVPVSKLMQSLKRFTAREGNRILGVVNQPFGQDESYDRLVRDDIEFERIANYVEMNPVTAGVVAAPEEEEEEEEEGVSSF